MHVRFTLAIALIIACSSQPARRPPPAWTEDDTVHVLRGEWERCRDDGGGEDFCEAHVRAVAVFFPPLLRVPLTPCGALCNTASFCRSGIIQRCQFCNFGTCSTVMPQEPAP